MEVLYRVNCEQIACIYSGFDMFHCISFELIFFGGMLHFENFVRDTLCVYERFSLCSTERRYARRKGHGRLKLTDFCLHRYSVSGPRTTTKVVVCVRTKKH
jgi:hypothetical protein